MFIRSAAAIAIAMFWALPPSFAQDATDHVAHHPGTAAEAVGPRLSEGEVRKVDRSAGKVTIRHGELRSLDMPAMTMVFRVKDPTILADLKEGDRIRFTAEKVDGNFIVTELERVK